MSLITAPLPVSPQVMWPLPLSFSVIPPSSRHVQLQSGTHSIPCVCAHTVFLTQTPIQTHSLHGFLAQSCGPSPPAPPPVSLHFHTQVNLQMQHTCILTSYTRMHARTLPEPPFSFLPLPLSNTPSARSEAVLQIWLLWCAVCVLGLPSLSLSSTSGPAYCGLEFFCLLFLSSQQVCAEHSPLLGSSCLWVKPQGD